MRTTKPPTAGQPSADVKADSVRRTFSRADLAANQAALATGEIHLWLAPAQAGDGTEELVWSFLSGAERARAGKIRAGAGRAEFVQAHALIRAVLSQYRAVEPGAWRFGRGALGKPFITAPNDAPPLQFNLSHTRGLAVCVVTLALAAGVDVEWLEPHADLPAVAREFLAPAAVQELEILSRTEQTIRFYELWTMREARSKAAGTGLTAPVVENESGEDWRCWQQWLASNHILAAAVRGRPETPTVFRMRTVRWCPRTPAGSLEACAPEQVVCVGPAGCAES